MERGRVVAAYWRVKRFGHCLGFNLTVDQILFPLEAGRLCQRLLSLMVRRRATNSLP